MMRIITRTLVFAAVLLVSACNTAPKSEVDRTALRSDAEDTAKLFKFTDPGLEEHFKSAAGYAVFPKVTKGGAGLGGAHGYGILYVKNQPTGWCSLSQGTVGLQLGGQSFSELIFFEDDYSVERFKRGEFAFSGNASAVAAASGASATAKYNGGVMVFTMPRGGLMLEASIGGQNFGYEPM